MGPFELVLGVVKLLTCIGQSNMGGRITDAACVNLSCITLYRPATNVPPGNSRIVPLDGHASVKVPTFMPPIA